MADCPPFGFTLIKLTSGGTLPVRHDNNWGKKVVRSGMTRETKGLGGADIGPCPTAFFCGHVTQEAVSSRIDGYRTTVFLGDETVGYLPYHEAARRIYHADCIQPSNVPKQAPD